MKHLFVKIFGGSYTEFEGTPIETNYRYKGYIPSWIERKWYNFRKKRLLKASNKLSMKIMANNAKGVMLNKEADLMIKRLENFN